MVMRKNLKTIVSSNIRKYRSDRDLTQENLAEYSGIDYKYIQRIESKNPPNLQLDTIEKIGKALKIDPLKLFEK